RANGRHIAEPYTPPYVFALPETISHVVTASDKFLILADVVHACVARGEADLASRAIVEAVLTKAAETEKMTLSELLDLEPGKKRRDIHDDTTVVHRRFDKASALLSGVCEEEKEKHVLLDDIVSLLDDQKVIAAAKKNDTASEDKDKVEKGALIVRDVAMRTLKRRKDCELDEPKKKSPTENRRNSLAAAIEAEGERELAVREKELEFQRFKFEAELKERELLRGLDREEKKAERDHQVLLAASRARRC
ncbi:hypothetical protein DYB28_000906, partial [Aphanomyces astaci]